MKLLRNVELSPNKKEHAAGLGRDIALMKQCDGVRTVCTENIVPLKKRTLT